MKKRELIIADLLNLTKTSKKKNLSKEHINDAEKRIEEYTKNFSNSKRNNATLSPKPNPPLHCN